MLREQFHPLAFQFHNLHNSIRFLSCLKHKLPLALAWRPHGWWTKFARTKFAGTTRTKEPAGCWRQFTAKGCTTHTGSRGIRGDSKTDSPLKSLPFGSMKGEPAILAANFETFSVWSRYANIQHSPNCKHSLRTLKNFSLTLLSPRAEFCKSLPRH